MAVRPMSTRQKTKLALKEPIVKQQIIKDLEKFIRIRAAIGLHYSPAIFALFLIEHLDEYHDFVERQAKWEIHPANEWIMLKLKEWDDGNNDCP